MIGIEKIRWSNIPVIEIFSIAVNNSGSLRRTPYRMNLSLRSMRGRSGDCVILEIMETD